VGTTLDMLTEWELWACANHFVEKHQADAPIMAAMRADELLAEGDFDGVRAFNAIVRRINQLLEEPVGRTH
jgi:hypothetical protein